MEPHTPTSFLARNEFIIRRLHSLSGLIPVGAYMVVHLLVNASIMDSPGAFQKNVYQIHSLGDFLLFVEWGFIFLPLIFHAVFGVVIIRGGLPNQGNYTYGANVRYTMQRVSGMIAFLFIFWHVFHMHGWFHTDWWLENVARPLQGAKFSPFNAASSGANAMQESIFVPIAYLLGVFACVFHLANGIWTMGITWGVWITPKAQKWASTVCLIFGIGLGVVATSGIYGFSTTDKDAAKEVEDKQYKSKIEGGELDPKKSAHKRSHSEDDTHHDEGE